MALYYRDPETGDHVIMHETETLLFPSREEALRAAHDLQETSNARRDHPARRSRRPRSRT